MNFYERVISDFGGYEKCKNILSQPNIDFIMNVQELRKHMLEYRRKHNIFEVGDKVVFLDEPIIRVITDVFTVTRVDSDSLTKGLILSSSDCDGFGYQNQMRHATGDEIKAGHRL